MQAGGASINRGGVSGDSSPPISWTQELVNKLLEVVVNLGGPYKATPRAVLQAVNWPGLSEAQVAGFLQVGILGYYGLYLVRHCCAA